MKNYLATFHGDVEQKIPLIKLVRYMTQMGLRESKEFVEQVIIPKMEYTPRFQLKLTELQLGRYYIATAGGTSFGKNRLNVIEPYMEPTYIDITKVVEA